MVRENIMDENSIKNGRKPKNPLLKRVWRDIVCDWKRCLMIFLMLTVTISFVSGMYVANNSMMTSIEENKKILKLESGHFEISKKADSELISALETGEKADVISVFRERAYDEAETEVKSAVDEKIEEQVAQQVKDTITAQSAELAEKQIAELKTKLTESQKQEMIDSAIETAISENYDKAFDEALRQAYDSDEYHTALDDALSEAKEKINEEIDKKYDDISERYGLESDFAPIESSIYELFYKNAVEKTDDESYKGKVKVYIERNQIDLYDILDGRSPQNENEIIIDRMHADNAGIKIGDTLYVGNTSFSVVGLVGFVDYTTLFENNTDSMFDALTFDVAMTTEKGFEKINESLHFNYAFKYKKAPADIYEEKTMSDNFLKVLITQTAVCEEETEIKDYVPSYANNSVIFAPNDMGSDKSMGGVLLYILTAVLAFIFAVTELTALEKESSVIGTLRASGYTRGELLAYYMSMPVIVVLVSAIVGNILGYTCMKYTIVSMYYNSYSLQSYKTIWTPEAFVKTTVIPVFLMLVINFLIVKNMLKLSPLRFLTHNLKKTKNKKAVRLPNVKFFSRFRMRVFLQNIPNYLMMFVGISFVMLLLSMAVGMPETLKYYQNSIPDMMFASEQIILSDFKDEDGNVIETENEDAERFSIASLVRKSDKRNEEISIYGIFPESKYIHLDKKFIENNSPSDVYISEAFAQKYKISEGDTITLDEKYENKSYDLKVCGIYDYSAGIAVFMPNDALNELFGRKADSFNGYMSDTAISDIDKNYIAKKIVAEDMVKIANQLDHSMGNYIEYFQYVCVIISAILLYLLTKIIIEKNERSISMVKILGYTDGEIAGLYLSSTCIVVFITEFIAVYIGYELTKIMWDIVLMEIDGYFAFVLSMSGFVKEFLLVFVSYIFITVIDFFRIRKIPKVLALKNME